jgi:fructose-1,6-bisphosphatase II
MKRELAIEFSRATEVAALAAYKLLGRGDKNAADQAAVTAMRVMLNKVDINGEVVIGEGEIDDAPMLYIGESVGTKHGVDVDIAVDPVEGTRMTALGQNNAVSVLAAAEKGSLLQAPDMYMEKLVCRPEAKGKIDLSKSLAENLKTIAKCANKPLEKLTVAILAKPRHDEIIKKLYTLGVKVFAFPDGDVAASILTCMPDSEVDVMYGIGGAPEGVISAAVIRALGGDMQAKLLTRDIAKGATLENIDHGKVEKQRCSQMGVTPGDILTLEQMVKSDHIIFSATGITNGDLLQGITRNDNIATTETLVIRGKSRTIRRIKSIHYLDRKDSELKDILL